MTVEEIIRAWTDEEYRLSLSEEQLLLLPEHPAGLVELDDTLLEAVGGASQRPTIGPYRSGLIM
jgi:mersacidin/lichenicidin family type 2 lantibiotic